MNINIHELFYCVDTYEFYAKNIFRLWIITAQQGKYSSED